MATKTQAKEVALDSLRAALPPGSTVYTVVRHVSRSGLQRVISAHYIRPEHLRSIPDMDARAAGIPDATTSVLEPAELRWLDLSSAGFRMHKTERGYVVNGTGMDMAFHVVYSLSVALHGDGYALTPRAL